MRPLGSIILGIGDYHYGRSDFPLLQYSPDDAHEVAEYIKTCWPKNEDITLIRITEANASAKVVMEAFDTLRNEGPYDLQLIFLSGHGFVDSQTAGFVLQPSVGSTDLVLLDSECLNRLMMSVPAKRTILILDCCYAEGITRRMTFFGGLGESDARLFIASSRASQLTWEDEQIGHGIFTAHLLDLLKTGSSVRLKGVRDYLDVDGELFPILCDQVPLYVFERKHQRQEPVKGGVSILPIKLPVARAARRIRARTAFGSAVHRFRQIVTGTALICLAFLCIAFTLTYYAEADRNGDVYLHYGTKWLAPILRFLPGLRTDTGISYNDLSDDPTSRYPVQTGATWGFWTQMSRQGYRSWYEIIRPGLSSKAAERFDVLIGADSSRPAYRLNDDSRPSDIAFAAWALLDNSDSKQLNTVLSRVLGADRTSPLLSGFSIGDLDFNILDRTQPQLQSFADALRSTAIVDPDRTFVAYLGFLKANQIWLAHSSPEQHGEEAQRRATEDVAEVLAVIGKERIDRNESALDPTMYSQLTELGNQGYEQLVRLALSRVAVSEADRKLAEMQALSAFHGHAGEPAEHAAILRLKDSLDSSAFSQGIVEQAYKRFVAVGGEQQSDLTAFLISAAEKGALPSTVMTLLVKKAQEGVARKGHEFMDTEYARVLAHGMAQVPAASRPLVYQLIAKVTASVTPLASSTAEIYTALARQELETPEMFRQVVAEATAAPPYKPEDPELVAEPLPGLSIVVGHEPWLGALAILGFRRTLPSNAIEILKNHAQDPTLHDDIVHALANQPTFIDKQCWMTSCAQMLKALAKDGPGRQLASDILAEDIAALPRPQFLGALEALRRQRAIEVEPEIRIALGLAAVSSQLARIRTRPVGSQLFE